MSILNRLFRRGPDAETTTALLDLLAQRSVRAQAAAEPQAIVRPLALPRGTRALAVIELDAAHAPLRHLIASRIGGDAAGHAGRMTVTGIHVTLDRRALSEQWPQRWTAALHAQPSTAREGIGETREFVWRPIDATAPGATEAVELLTSNQRAAARVSSALREPGVIQIEVAPSDSWVRVAAHRTGSGLPFPTTLDAVLTVARAIAGAE